MGRNELKDKHIGLHTPKSLSIRFGATTNQVFLEYTTARTAWRVHGYATVSIPE
jgi:hypothetical protein